MPAAAPPKTPAERLTPIDLTEVPDPCRTIAKQAGAANLATALSARMSLATCLADAKLAPLTLCDCEDSVLALDEATKQSFALFDEVATAAPDPAQKIIAERAKADLYTNMSARMTATLPTPGGDQAAVALYNARKTILDGLLVRWRDAAAGSYERIVAMVKADPKLEKNPVVASALRIAKDRLRMQVAVAKPPPQPEPVPGEGSKAESDATDDETLR